MRWRLSYLGGLVATALVPALSAGPATAKITFEGVAGVEIGMSESEVRDKVGEPAAAVAEDQGAKLLEYPRRKLDVLLREDRVVRVRTTSRAERTRSGVGPGRSEREMRRKLRGERCGSARGARVCWVLDGKTVLSFTCRRGRVVVAEVARSES